MLFKAKPSLKRYILIFTLAILCSINGVGQLQVSASTNNVQSLYSVYNNEEYFFPEQAPGVFTYNAPTSFQHWLNRHVYTKHTPHHRGFDQILKPWESQLIQGKFHYGDIRKDLEDEWISIYVWRTEQQSWQYITRLKTDGDGYIRHILTGDQRLGVGIHPVKMVVEGDNTYANMYIQIVNGQEKFVVFDIDGTLTLSDSEMVYEVIDGFFTESYEATPYANSQQVVRYYTDRGYQIIYLTARPYWLGDITYKWLIDRGYPLGMVHTMATGDSSPHDVYKTTYLSGLVNKGISIPYAYGNATTDIIAYNNIGVPKSHTYIIGKNAGNEGTVPIVDYNTHYNHLLQQD